MTMNKIFVIAVSLFLASTTVAAAQNNDGSATYVPQYGNSYTVQSYPQGFDQEYRLPTVYGNQYYQQEPEGAVTGYGSQRTAQSDRDSNVYHQQYYYY